MKKVIIFIIVSFFGMAFAMNQTAQSIFIIKLLEKYNAPAVSIAIIQDNKIRLIKVYVNPNYANHVKINTNTLFQAASISKAVTAYGTLILVQQKKLHLNRDVNQQLKNWKITLSSFTKNHPVLLQQLLSMTGGFPQDGYAGYKQGAKMPNNLQILNGQLPANSPSIHLRYVPGVKYAYCGAGFQIIQQMMTDITGESFPVLMQKLVLKPLKMKRSFYANHLPRQYQKNVARGYLAHGQEVSGGWHNYPELGAASLWTTSHDLALFVININHAYQGNGLIHRVLARKMLTRQPNTDFGLGVIVSGQGKNLNFRKAGHNLGYHTQIIGFPMTGQGAVIMTNSENGEPFIYNLANYLGHTYHWPKFYPLTDELQREK